MNILPRLLGLGLLSLLVGLLLLTSCETTKPGRGEFGSPTKTGNLGAARSETRTIVQVTDSTMEFKTPQAELARAFIRQFGDGTVVDKVLVRKAPVGKGETAGYFLVGMGQRGGNFRAMALPLSSGGDNTFALSPTAERYIITSVGCSSCFFTFENGHIVGTTCGDNSGGSVCDLTVESSNALFATR